MAKQSRQLVGLVSAFVIWVALSGNAAAQGIDADVSAAHRLTPGTKTGISVGLGAAVVPDYEGSEDYQVVPVPFLTVKFKNHMSIDWVANKARANLIPSSTWKAGPVLQYIRERDDVDSDKVDDLEDVDASLMVGGFLGFEINNWNAGVEAMADVADGNDGATIRIKGGYKIPIAQTWSISIDAFTTWADDDYMDAYFDVDARDSARSGLNTFDADSGFKDVGGILSVSYSPWNHWSIMGVGAYKRLLDDAEDSPVTDDEGDENQFFGGALVIYHF